MTRSHALWIALLISSGGLILGYSARGQEEIPPTRLLVELREGSSDSTLREARRHVRRLTDIAPRSYLYEDEHRTSRDLRRWRVVDVPANEAANLLTALRNNPAVTSADYVRHYTTAALPNDALFAQQYSLYSPSQSLADINAPEAWDTTTGSADTVIAIIDGGVDFSHEDLDGKAWQNDGEIADNNSDDDGNGFIDDVTGWDFVRNQPNAIVVDHATHVAGIAAAEANNGTGIAGADWQARLMSVRVLSSGGVGNEDAIVRGILYAVANGADIINLSLVGSASPAMQAAIEHAYASNVVVVAAAGNAGRDTGNSPVYPACADVGGIDMVVGVAATDEAGEPASFSNKGSCINIAAPGDSILSTRTGNRYGAMKGTSMASPLVAGVAGLYKSQHPSASAAEIIAVLSNGDSFVGDQAGEWNEDYRGKLNAAMVVGAPSTNPASDSGGPSAPAPISTNNQPTESSSSTANSSGDSGGGGGGGNSGGGGGGEEVPEPTVRPRVAGIHVVKANLALLPRIKDTFRFVYGRLPTTTEKTYWANRVRKAEKRTYLALLGAMQWQQMKNIVKR